MYSYMKIINVINMFDIQKINNILVKIVSLGKLINDSGSS